MQNNRKNIDIIISSMGMGGMNAGMNWAADVKGKDNRGSSSGEIDLI